MNEYVLALLTLTGPPEEKEALVRALTTLTPSGYYFFFNFNLCVLYLTTSLIFYNSLISLFSISDKRK